MIANTLSITLAQRTREFATLRTLGATRRQILRSVIVEALVIGILGSVVGLFLGLALAKGLNAVFVLFGIDLPTAGTVFETRTVVVCLIVGTVITLIATHAAVVARQIGKPCVAGCHELVIDYATRTAEANGVTFAEGDWISVDGSTGEVFLGALPTVSARFEDQPELQTILGWADEVRRMEVWTNADKPEEAALARTLRRAGHRPVPDRAHVPRGRAARDRARRDPRRRRPRPGPRPRRRPAAR